jgi:hypothetical protein
MVITSHRRRQRGDHGHPQPEGQLTANAVRVPTPNGSLAIMSLHPEQGREPR